MCAVLYSAYYSRSQTEQKEWPFIWPAILMAQSTIAENKIRGKSVKSLFNMFFDCPVLARVPMNCEKRKCIWGT